MVILSPLLLLCVMIFAQTDHYVTPRHGLLSGNVMGVGTELSLEFPNQLPIAKEKSYETIKATVFAYNSEVNQTDGSPFITASGYDLSNPVDGRNIVANNCLPFGSIIRIGNGNYNVQDRMNKRYGCEVFDIWMPTNKEAKKFGKQKVSIKIYVND